MCEFCGCDDGFKSVAVILPETEKPEEVDPPEGRVKEEAVTVGDK